MINAFFFVWFPRNKIQRVVISGGNFKPDTLKPKEVVSLLLDDDELEKKRELLFYFPARLVFLELQAKWSAKGKTDAFLFFVFPGSAPEAGGEEAAGGVQQGEGAQEEEGEIRREGKSASATQPNLV